MAGKWWFRKNLDWSGLGLIEILYRNSQGETEVKYENIESGWPVSRQRIGQSTTTTPTRSAPVLLLSRVLVTLDFTSDFCVCDFKSQSYVTTDGQSASLSWNKAPIWGLRPDLNYCLTVAGLLIWGVLSDERTGLQFAIATGPRQRSHFRVRVP
jgi:hypothetical protein